MKRNRNLLNVLICISVFCMLLTGCNLPRLFHQSPTETPQPAESSTEADPMLINNSGADDNGEMMLHNNSGTPAATPEPTSGADDEELPIITNPGRSAVELPKTASLGFQSSFSSGTHSQIQNPSAGTDGDDLVIKNDHNITYPETPSIIQKSTPTSALTPLSYIPPTTLANGQSIAFAPGATSAVVSGYVQAGGYVSYNFYAFANQNFLVLLSSDSGTSVLSVTDIYGNVYLDANQRQTSYSMYLPRTATYYINIHSTGYSENFTIQVFIPARVTIPQGRTSTVLSGTLTPYSVVSYTAYMYAGQTARIDDYSGPMPNSFLRVSGLQTGQVYMDYTAYSPSWYAVVPTTQDYLIEVISIDQPSTYQLTVDVR